MVATLIVVTAFSAVSEIILPCSSRSFSRGLQTGGREARTPSVQAFLAAGLIVLGLLVLMTFVVVATVRGIVDQTDEIGASVDAAIDNASDELNVDPNSLNDAKAATQEAGPMIAEGIITGVRVRGQLTARPGQRPDPRRTHHVLSAQGRHRAPQRRASDRSLDPGRRR